MPKAADHCAIHSPLFPVFYIDGILTANMGKWFQSQRRGDSNVRELVDLQACIRVHGELIEVIHRLHVVDYIARWFAETAGF